MNLTPSTSWEAGPDNYCYWDRTERFAPGKNAGLIFDTVEDLATRIYDDYGWDTHISTGEPHGPWIPNYDIAHQGDYCVIGRPGFNWLMLDKLERYYSRFPHIGGVKFGARVTLDDFVTIDRGGVGDTHIGFDVHIDSHVHIGHNANIGDRTIITAGAIIGGSSIIGADSYIGLGAIIRNKATVGVGATIGMGAVVVEDVPSGETWVGNPARKLR